MRPLAIFFFVASGFMLCIGMEVFFEEAPRLVDQGPPMQVLASMFGAVLGATVQSLILFMLGIGLVTRRDNKQPAGE